MRLSIIIPAFNEESLLMETLERVRQASGAFLLREWEVEVIVCDNHSTDRTAEIARSAGAQVVFEPINQIARARNTGAAAASGDWLVFIDADSHPSAELFAAVADQIVSGRILAGGSTIRIDENLVMPRLIARFWNLASRSMTLMAGSFIFVDAEAFRKVGGFSHEWFAGEELELRRRLKKLAKASRRRIVILHRHPLTTSARKVKLYTPWDHLRVLAKVVLSGGKSLRCRESTHLWYDGRR